MPQKVLSIVIGLIIVVVLAYGGYFFGYQKGMEVPQLTILDTSKVIQVRYATATGAITEISADKVALTKDGDNLEVPLKDGANFTALVFSGSGTSAKAETKDITLGDIKAGEEAVVKLQINSGGSFEGLSVTVIRKMP